MIGVIAARVGLGAVQLGPVAQTVFVGIGAVAKLPVEDGVRGIQAPVVRGLRRDPRGVVDAVRFKAALCRGRQGDHEDQAQQNPADAHGVILACG